MIGIIILYILGYIAGTLLTLVFVNLSEVDSDDFEAIGISMAINFIWPAVIVVFLLLGLGLLLNKWSKQIVKNIMHIKNERL